MRRRNRPTEIPFLSHGKTGCNRPPFPDYACNRQFPRLLISYCLPHSFLEKMAIPIINGYPYYRIRCHVQKFLFPIPPIIQINLCALYVDPQNLLYIQFERIALDFRELSVFRIDDDIFQSIGRLFFRIAYRTVLRHASLRQPFVFGIYVERFGICN